MRPSRPARPIDRSLRRALALTLLALLTGSTASPPAGAADPEEGGSGARTATEAAERPADAGPGGRRSEQAADAGKPPVGRAEETPVAGETRAPGAPGQRAGMPSAIGQFTTAVEDREPVDAVTFVSNDTREIYFFTDLRNLEGHVVTHRWIYSGRTMAEVDFQVRGPRWRVWSSKELVPDWIGDWTVEIVTEDGEVIAAETFTYSAPST